MSIKVNIEISVSNEGYTEHEATILAALAAHPSQGAAAVIPAAAPLEKSDASKAADARIAEAKAKAAEEAKAKAAAAAKTKAAAEAKAAAAAAEAEAAVEEPAEEASEDLVGDSEPTAAYTLEDAVSAATKLVSSGRAAEVKAALAQTSAKKVSELKGADLNTFMTVLAV